MSLAQAEKCKRQQARQERDNAKRAKATADSLKAAAAAAKQRGGRVVAKQWGSGARKVAGKGRAKDYDCL